MAQAVNMGWHLPLGRQTAESTHSFLEPRRGQAREQSAGRISAALCDPFAQRAACTTLSSSTVCGHGTARSHRPILDTSS